MCHVSYFVDDYEAVDEDVLGSGQGMQVPMTQTGSSAKSGEPARIRSLFPETWLWDIVSIGWVVG